MKHLPMTAGPAGASAFEHLAAKLGLLPEQYAGSPVLKEWARKNRNGLYVPPELLQVWGFVVDTGYAFSPEDYRNNRSRQHTHIPID
jgi:hypothetical protein